MKILGIILFLIGAFFLIGGAVVGRGGISNLPATLLGSSCLISGSILAAIGFLHENLNKNYDELKSIIGIPENKLPKVESKVVANVSTVSGEMVDKGETTIWEFRNKTFSSEEQAKEAEAEYRKNYSRE